MSKKRIITLAITASFFFILSIIALLIPLFLSDEQGHYEDGWIFFLLFLLSAILLIICLRILLSDTIASCYEKELKKYSETPFSILPDSGEENVLQTFQKHGFKEVSSGIYRKKIFSGIKGSICYYLTLTDVEDLDAAFESAENRFEGIHEKSPLICLILFFYKAGVTESDIETITERSSGVLATESVLLPKKYVTMLPILVDTSIKNGMYLEKNSGITVYAYACRLLKKYLQ